MYNAQETADLLNISLWTLKSWYEWQRKYMRDNNLTDPILPVPYKIKSTRGNPNMWTEEQIEKLKRFQIEHSKRNPSKRNYSL